MQWVSTMNNQPSLNGNGGGRGHNGRFLPGNKLGKGNPHARAVNQLRAVLFEVVTPERNRKAVDAISSKAEGGIVRACRRLTDRTLGKAVASDILLRLESLEKKLNEHQ
jgi:hypothetical protein